MGGYLIVLALILAAAYFVYKNVASGEWKISSPENAMIRIFRLQPGEQIIHQSSGIHDPNSHLKISETLVKNVGLGVIGKKLVEPQSISLAITNQNRFIFSHDPRLEPVAFDKHNLPKIIDTGRKSQKISTIPALYRYPGTSGECRIIEIDSPVLPELIMPDNSDKFEISTPVEFIPLIMEWLENCQNESDHS